MRNGHSPRGAFCTFKGACLAMATAGVSVGDLLASAFSSTLDSTVVSYDQYVRQKSKRGKYFQPLNIDQLFQVSYLRGKVGDKDTPTTSSSSSSFDINVNTLDGGVLTIAVTDASTIGDVKEEIEVIEGTPINKQRIMCGGNLLYDCYTLQHYGVTQESCLLLLYGVSGGGVFYVDDSLMV